MQQGKLRPVLLLSQLPYGFDDWLICMVSSKTQRYVSDLDEHIDRSDDDFIQSSLKEASVIRAARLAVVSGDILLGAIWPNLNKAAQSHKTEHSEVAVALKQRSAHSALCACSLDRPPSSGGKVSRR